MPDVVYAKLVLDFRAGVEFTPTADPSDATWGAWECWLNCKGGELPNGTAGIVPTGDWLCWNRDEPDQKFGFADPKMAETFCVYHNGPGERTRVVDPFKGARESAIRFEDVAPAIEAEMVKLSPAES